MQFDLFIILSHNDAILFSKKMTEEKNQYNRKNRTPQQRNHPRRDLFPLMESLHRAIFTHLCY